MNDRSLLRRALIAVSAVIGLSLGALGGGGAWAAADTSPPTLISASVDRGVFNLADGPATFTVTVRASDPAGVSTPVVTSGSETTGQSAGFGQMSLVAGSASNGTWQRTITIPVTAAPGAWTVTHRT